MFPRKRPTPAQPDHHYELALLEDERDALLHMLRHDKRPTISLRNKLVERVDKAKRHSGAPLPDAVLDWASLELEAARQGCSVGDVFFDRARAKDPR